jgi:hypothetical protein
MITLNRFISTSRRTGLQRECGLSWHSSFGWKTKV